MYAARTNLVLLWCFCLFLEHSASAMFMRPVAAPVDRIVANLRSYLDENPDDANAHYQLARACYLSFANRSFLVPHSGDRDGVPTIAPEHLLGDWLGTERHAEARRRALEAMQSASEEGLSDEQLQKFYEDLMRFEEKLRVENWEPSKVEPEEALVRAAESLAAFDRAIELSGDEGLYHLGRASLIEQLIVFREKHEAAKVPKPVQSLQVDNAVAGYRKAYELTVDSDLKREEMPLGGLSTVISHEAGTAWLRLCETATNDEREAVSRTVQKMKKLRVGMVTPIILATRPVGSISELQRNGSIPFDFDADGRKELWNWIQPEAGFLVWLGTSSLRTEIKDGSQLMGNHAFQMLWRNGFEPLVGLDDDQNRFLEGSELTGLGVWFDLNSNGKSEQGELISVQQLEIVAIATRPTGTMEGLLTNQQGIRFLSGESLPTWDWLASPSTGED